MNAIIGQNEYEALAAFRYALRQFLHFSEEAAQAVGLTPHQHQALLAIKGYPDQGRITVGELANRLQVRHHSAVGLANRLAAQGLLVRMPSQEDHRQVFLTLTPKGQDLLERLSAVHQEELRRIGPQLGQLLKQLTGGG